jgi:hypothetical protein
LADLGADLGRKGQKDSSIELVKRVLAEGHQANALRDIELEGLQLGAQAGLSLPFQQADTQIGANTALFQRLMGTSGTALDDYLRSRLGRGSQTQSGGGLQSFFQMGQSMAQGGYFKGGN